MNKGKLSALIFVLLRDSFTVSDMERICDEVEAGVKADSPLAAIVTECIVDRLMKSGLKCSENMCNTEYDDVKMVSVPNDSGSERIESPMCADCRRRNPEAVLLQD